jgi:hypothetical protein
MRYLERAVWVVLVGSAFCCFGACGSDDEDSSGGGNSAALTSCNQFCDKSAGQSCQLVDAATCKQICSALMQSLDASCAAKQKAMYDCQLAQSDVCNTPACQTQTDEASACLSGG